MNLRDLFLHKNINAGVARFRENPAAVLLDVRTRPDRMAFWAAENPTAFTAGHFSVPVIIP